MNEKEQNREILSQYLLKLIDDELDKDDCNMELIDKYNAILDELDGNASDPDPKRKEQALKELRKAYREAASKKQAATEEPTKVKRRFRFPKWKVVAAACLCLIIMTPMAVSAFSGVGPIELIANLGRRIFTMEKNTPYDYGMLTFMRTGESKLYRNIEECLKQEKLDDILYPTWLPDGMKIESVMFANDGEGDTVVFQFNDDSIQMVVHLYNVDVSVYAESSDYQLETFNEIDCYIENFGRGGYNNGYHHVLFTQNGYTYTISLKDMEILPLIMENLA